MNPIHEQFIAEGRELIQQATDDLIALERDGASAGVVDRILRAFHTLKGAAGLVELPAMALSLHAAEDLATAIQAGRVSASTAVVSAALECLGQVSRWIDAFEADGVLPSHAGEQARDTAEALRRHLARPGSVPASAGPGRLPDGVGQLLVAHRPAIGRDIAARPRALFGVLYEPRADCFFDGDDPLRLVRQIPDLLALRVDLRDEAHTLAELDPFKCRLRLTAIAGEPRDALSAIFRLVPDEVRIVEIPPEELPAAPAATEDAALSLGRAIVAEQREVLHASGEGDDFAGRVGASARAAANALMYAGRGALADAISRAAVQALAGRDAAPLLGAVDAALEAIAPSVVERPAAGAAEARAPELSGAARRWLRVEEVRVDALVNLAGELMVMSHRFGHLAKRMEAELGAHDLARAMRREQDAVERLGSDIHSAILQLRMVPVAQVLRAVPQLVRDLAQRFDKKVRLVTRGETTESDKAVVDRLFEPVLHLVRNAVDHGIEPPEERKAAGKPDTATLTIEASRQGDRIILAVSDDGRGMDPAAIRRKAGERGLVAADALAQLGDEEVLELIFSAGFSTADVVSDISGRGVGMDVVRTAVERIGGRVSLASRVGQGTTDRLDLPVSIAMSRVMVVECAGQRFGIPMDAVTETLRLDSDSIRRVKHNEGFVLRDRVVPICSLAELMRLPGGRSAGGDARRVIVVEVGGRIAGIEIDAISDRIDVILKPMQGVLANARGYAGTSLLGDGTVLLILDIKELLS